MNTVRTRIAPSPTGADLHIGNAYTALINYVFAKKHGGQFLVRIEDTDRTRLVTGAEQKILDSLHWLGLDFDEGPGKENPRYGSYQQSQRLPIYHKYAKELIALDGAYYCFCTPERLEDMRSKLQENKLPPKYDGFCRKLAKSESQTRVQKGEKYTIRLKVPEAGITEFQDIIRGKISFENKQIDDAVLIKSDGFPTYHFGVVVDDHLMEISHIIRGEEWISSVPKHIILYKSFGWELPVFAHLPLLRNPDKSKLSKRKNPVWVSWYKEQGFLPWAILNYLALMGWSMPDGRDKFNLEEFTKEFRLEDIQTTAPVFDIEKLKWFNMQHLKGLPKEEYARLITNFSIYHPPEKAIEPMVDLVKERIKTLAEFDNLAGAFFKAPEKYELDMKSYKAVFKQMKDKLNSVAEWKADEIGRVMQDLATELKMKNSEFFMILRVAIFGKKISPPLNESMKIMGKQEILLRLSNV